MVAAHVSQSGGLGMEVGKRVGCGGVLRWGGCDWWEGGGDG